MRRFIAALCVALCAMSLFATKYVETEHFEIIYDNDCENFASVIYDNCEQIYSEVAALFGTSTDLHMPVYITSGQKVFNAYFTSYPYNHIVLYNTALSSVNELSNFSDVALSVFRHELSHAVSIGIQTPFWQKASDIFSDALNPGYWFYMMPSWTEGLAVWSESSNGEGRNNEPSTNAMLMQAKLEGSFPTFIDASGARDVHTPLSDFYTYGGAFTGYLADTYGEDKVARMVNSFNTIGKTGRKIFQSTFGVSRDQAWKDFEESVKLPEDILQPAERLSDDENAYYSDIVVSQSGRMYVAKNSAWTVARIDDITGITPVFFASTNNSDISVKQDGAHDIFLMPYISEDFEAVRVYDSTGFAIRQFDNFRSGCFFGDGYLLCSYDDLGVSLAWLDTDGNWKDSFDLGYGITVSEFTTTDFGAAFVISQDGICSIGLADIVDGKIRVRKVDTPVNMKIKSIACVPGSGTLTISYIVDGGFARFASLEIATPDDIYATAMVSEKDFSGGINYPVLVDGKVTYSASFYEEGAICRVTLDDLACSEQHWNITAFTPATRSFTKLDGKQYIPFEHIKDFTFIPGLAVGGTNYGLGASIFTCDPTEQWNFQAATGTDFASWFVDADASYAKNRFLATTDLSLGIYFSGWASLSFDCAAQYEITLRDLGETLTIGANTGVWSAAGFMRGDLAFSATYQHVRKTDLTPFGRTGWGAGMNISTNGISLSGSFEIPRVKFWANMSNPWNISASAGVDSVPFSIEIQDSIDAINIYIQRVKFTADASVSYYSGFLFDTHIGAYLEFTPVVGMFAKSKLCLGVNLGYSNGQGLYFKFDMD